MKRKFYILTALLASVTLAVSSCEEALEEVVYSSLTQDIAFTTGENAQGAVDAMYIPLHQLYRELTWAFVPIAQNGSTTSRRRSTTSSAMFTIISLRYTAERTTSSA